MKRRMEQGAGVCGEQFRMGDNDEVRQKMTDE